MTASKLPRLEVGFMPGARSCNLTMYHGAMGGRDHVASLDEFEARDLIAQLTAWLDAPRLAARETATGTGADLIAAGDTDGPGSPHECPKCCGWTVYEADDATGGGQ